jgi:phage terminase small subunit
VQKYIAAAAEKLHNEKTADAQEVLEYLTDVLRGTAKSHEIVVEGMGDGCSEAREVEKRPSEKDRLKAAELLAKRYGLLTDNVKLDGNGVVEIVDDIPKAGKTD